MADLLFGEIQYKQANFVWYDNENYHTKACTHPSNFNLPVACIKGG